MSWVLEYARISPAALANSIETQVPMACCMTSDIDDDYFQFSICGWLPLTLEDESKIRDIVLPYL